MVMVTVKALEALEDVMAEGLEAQSVQSLTADLCQARNLTKQYMRELEESRQDNERLAEKLTQALRQLTESEEVNEAQVASLRDEALEWKMLAEQQGSALNVVHASRKARDERVQRCRERLLRDEQLEEMEQAARGLSRCFTEDLLTNAVLAGSAQDLFLLLVEVRELRHML